MVLSDILAPHCDTIQLPSTPLLSFLDFKHSRRLLVECYIVIISKTKSNRASFLMYTPTLFPVSQRDSEDPFTNSIRREEQSTADKNIGVGSQGGFKTQLPHILAVCWLFPFRIVRILEFISHKKADSGRLKI